MESDKVMDAIEAAIDEARTDPNKSRELSLVTTKLEEALLWRQRDQYLKAALQPGVVLVERELGA